MLGRHRHPVVRITGAVALLVVALLPFTQSTPVDAMSTPMVAPRTVVATQNGGSSCVGTFVGWTTGNVVWSPTTRVAKVKCYFDPTNAPGDWDSGQAWLGTRRSIGGDFVPRASTGATGCIAPTTFVSSLTGGTDTYAWGTPGETTCSSTKSTSEYSVLVSSTGYVEFMFKQTQNNGGSSEVRNGVTPVTMIIGGTGNTSHAYVGLGPEGLTATTGHPLTGKWVFSQNYESTMPPYRWGPEVFPAACPAMDMFLADPGRSFAPGEFASIEFLGADSTYIGANIETLRYRWSPNDPWRDLWQSAGVLNPAPPSEPILIRNGENGDRAGVTLEIECTDIHDAVRYLRGDTSDSTTAQASRACSAVSFVWPTDGAYEASEEKLATMTVRPYSGTDQITGMSASVTLGLVVHPDSITQVRDWATRTFLNPLGTLISFPLAVGAGSYGVPFAFDEDWTTEDGLTITCVDGSGSLNFRYSSPAAVGKLPSESGYSDRFNECLDGIDFGWKPSSWVPAGFRTFGCVLQVLFVPTSSDIDTFVAGWNDLSAKAPVSFVTETGVLIYGFFDDMPATLTAHRTECVPLLQADASYGLDEDLTMCPTDLASSTMTAVRGFLGAAVYLMTAYGLWQSTRRVLHP